MTLAAAALAVGETVAEVAADQGLLDLLDTALNGDATMDLHHWWRFRDGKVCLYRGSEDTALTATLLS